MAESIKSRVGRILAGGVNRLIEVVEGVAPETVLEQTVREIEIAIDEVRNELARQIAQKHLATRRLFEASKKHDELKLKTAVAVEQDRDDLAEAAISVQLDIEAQIPIIEQTIVDITEREKELEGYLRALQGRVGEMRDEIIQYRSQKNGLASTNDEGEKYGDIDHIACKVARAESAFERLMQRATGIPSGVMSSDFETSAKIAELEGLSKRNRIQERLAIHKATLTQAPDKGGK